MGTGISTPLINGRRFSYASVEVALLKPDGSSEIFIDVDSIDYSEQLNISFMRGTGQAPIGWTAGEYEAGDLTLSIAKSHFQTGIVEGIGEGWLGANLQVTVKYADEGEPTCSDVLTTRISGAADAPAVGPDPLAVKMTCKCMQISRNGINPLKGMK